MADAVREQSDLRFGAAGIGFRTTVLLEYSFLYF
jgi:hypothetical protein